MNILLTLIYIATSGGYAQTATITKYYATIADCQTDAHEISMLIAEKGYTVTQALCQEIKK